MGNFGEILNHSRNYLIANLATKALAFISIPVYTRLLTTEDYGIVSIFLGIVGVFNSLFTLGCDCAVSRYYFEKKDENDFKSFVGTSILLSIIVFCVNVFLFLLFASTISINTQLSIYVTYLIIPVVLFNSVGLMFEQIYNPQKKSSLIAKYSLFRVYLGFSSSVLLIILFQSEKFYGQILGQIVAGIVLTVFWIKKIRPYFIFSFSKRHLKYILLYSLPLVPYSMSGVLIEQFGKLAIGNNSTISDAGYYSLALSISGLVAIIINITHQAWNPYYFEYMNSKNYIQHDKDQNRIFRITIFGGFFLAEWGMEIGMMLAKSSFTSSLHLIPILVIGYIFYQLAYVYMRNFGYTCKTIFSTLTVLVSSLLNIIINVYAVPRWGELGAAISFVIAYISMAFTAWFFNRFIIKFHTSPLKIFLLPLFIVLPFFIAIYFVRFDNYFLSISFRLILLGIVALILFWHERLLIIEKIRLFILKL